MQSRMYGLAASVLPRLAGDERVTGALKRLRRGGRCRPRMKHSSVSALASPA